MTKRVCILGATGCIGRAVAARFSAEGYFVKSDRTDLTCYEKVIRHLSCFEPHIVINCAGLSSGLQYSLDHPAEIFYANTVIPLNVIKACVHWKIPKVVNLIASCAYPDYYNSLCEEDILKSTPHCSVACHGYAKRNTFLASRWFSKEFGIKAICICPPTVYGPHEASGERQKVMGGLIKKIVDAADSNSSQVVLWGSGYARREFLHVRDAAYAIMKAAELYNDTELPLNLGAHDDVSIHSLAEIIAEEAGFKGQILWDKSKPDGQKSKKLSRERALISIGEFETTPLREGIKECICEYRHSNK